jgi:hypothetical protein
MNFEVSSIKFSTTVLWHVLSTYILKFARSIHVHSNIIVELAMFFISIVVVGGIGEGVRIERGEIK